MATATYEWKQPAPKVPAVGGALPKSPTDPMGAPTQGQSPKSMFGPTEANKPSTPSFGDLLKGTGPVSPTPSFSDLLQSSDRQSNVQAAQGAISKDLTPQQGSSQSGQLARNSFLKSQDEAQRQIMEQSALQGRQATGQIVGDNVNFLTKQAQPARMDFETALQAQEDQQSQQRQQGAISNLLALEGLGSQERIAGEQNALTARGQDIQKELGLGDLSVREKQLTQAGSQFADELAFKKFATEGGWSQEEAARVWQSMENEKAIQSTEKISFAKLNVEEKALAQDAMQFTDRLQFDQWATQAGLDDKQKDRIWSATESEKERIARAEESGLSRELQKYIADQGFEIDEKQLTETIRQFDGKLAFDTWATQAGLDDNEKGRIWDGHLQDLDQKWATGERLGTQEHQALIEDKRIQASQMAQEFDRVANLEAIGKTQEWDERKLGLTQEYQTMLTDKEMTHDQAMTVLKGEMEKSLTEMGIDAQAARQAVDIEAQKWDLENQLKQEQTLAKAELMYKYKSLQTSANIDAQTLGLRKAEVLNQAAQFAQSFGLEEKKVLDTLSREENREGLEVQGILQELAGDDAEMIRFSSINFVQTLQQMNLVSPEDAATMIENINNPPVEENKMTYSNYVDPATGKNLSGRGSR